MVAIQGGSSFAQDLLVLKTLGSPFSSDLIYTFVDL